MNNPVLGVVPVPRLSAPRDAGCRFAAIPVVTAERGLAQLAAQFESDVERDGSLDRREIGPAGPSVEARIVTNLRTSVPPAQGLASGCRTADERFSLSIGPQGVLIEAADPEGARRGFTVLRQMLASANSPGERGVLPGCRIEDGPVYRWRGLSIDVARRFIPPDDFKRVIDLAALYHLSVLHVHLTDDEGWRLQIPGLPALTESAGGDGSYSVDVWQELVSHAADRGITLVPEVDVPGHCGALLDAYPEFAPAAGTWIDPTKTGALALVEQVLTHVASVSPGTYVHIGGDEAFGMPEDLFATVVRHARNVVREAGKEPVGWQEAARAGLSRRDVIQHWMVLETDRAVVERALTPEALALMEASVARSGDDIAAAAAAGAAILASPAAYAYLDRPYAEQSTDPDQEETRRRVGMRAYPPASVQNAYEWEPSAIYPPGTEHALAGVEAAVWCESVHDMDDLGFLLLPRLASLAEVAWSGAGSWTNHADAFAGHPRLWEAHGWHSWFRSGQVPWTM